MATYHELQHPTPYEIHDSAMLALLPDAESAERLAHPFGLPPGELHVTLAYLGDGVRRWPTTATHNLWDAVGHLVDYPALPLEARAFAHATFNPDGGPFGDRDPCAVYLIGDTPDLTPFRAHALDLARAFLATVGVQMAEQHAPFVPHLTAGYGLDARSLSYVGPVTFDRVVLALGERWIEVTP